MTTIAVSMGDPAGIGPELIRAAFEAFAGDDTISLLAVGDAAVLDAALGASARFGKVVPTAAAPCPDVTPGAPSPAAAPAIIAAIETGVTLVRSGRADALVTMPIAKSVLQAAGFGFPGHTEFLAHLTADIPMEGPRGPVMMLAGADLRVALATIHLPLAAVPGALSVEGIVHTGRVVARALRQDFGIAAPRLALCGLNPHAGENGAIGTEERDVLNPAAELLRAEGVDCGPAHSADVMFHPEARARYDAAIAMYHDQGLIPIKTIAFWEAVNVTLGLPIVRTSPDHGTGFDIAGRGVARADSTLAAIRLAADMAARRQG